MKDYGNYSFWLETAGDLTPRPPLDGSEHVDVAILGAGFTGLWTAYHLLKRDPSLNVAVVEAEIAGFGASGRNGGWCYSGFPVSAETLRERYGESVARSVALALYDSVDDVGEVCAAEDIDAHYIKSGALNIARADYDLPGLEHLYEQYRLLGLDDHYELFDADQTAERIRVTNTVGSFWIKEGASIQPARLARGLARAVERHGGTIYEQTRVTGFVPGPLPRLDTPRGNISAKVIVLAGEAYLSQVPQLERSIIPVTSHMVVTEPLSEEIWEQIGWEDRAVVSAHGSQGAYLNHTLDGRIAFGPYRGNYPFNSRIEDSIDRDEEIFAHGRDSARAWFPALKDVKFTHSWGGVFGMPRDGMPLMQYDRKSGIATGRGYSGQGVAAANLSGRVLADLITEQDTELTHLPMTQHVAREWEPEPIRWAGVTFVRKSRQRRTAEVERTGRYPEKPTLAQRLWDH